MKNLIYKIAAVWTLIVFTVTIIIAAIFIWPTYRIKEPRGTEIFRRIDIIWIRTFLFLVGCRLIIVGKENFKKGENYVVTCNHNSFLDVPILTPFVPGPNKTIAKIEMSKIPIFGMVYTRGSVLVDRKDKDSRHKSYLAMKEVLSQHLHMCLYPEGTRNRTNKPLGIFKSGAFRLALDTQKDIIPTLIFNTKDILPTGKGLYFKPGKIELHFLPAVKSSDFKDHQAFSDHVHSIMEEYYVGHLKKN